MTTPGGVPRLDYATPAAGARVNWFLRIMVALTLAMLGADAFALAAGFEPMKILASEPEHMIVRFFAGIIIFVLVLAAAGPLERLLRGSGQWVAGLGGGAGRAGALALIICGTVCIVAALATEVCLVRHAETAVPGIIRVSRNGEDHLVTGTRPPVFGRVLEVSAFVAGLALAAAGATAGTQSRRGP